MICIYLYLLLSSVCVYVCAYICGMRESNRGQKVCGASVFNLGGNSGSFWIVTTMPMYVEFRVCVCVYTSQFMYNKL